VVFYDITEHKQAEKALRESEGRFRIMADTAPVLIWLSDTNSLCTYVNKPWLDYTGHSIEQELGKAWEEGVHPADYQNCLDIYSDAFKKRCKYRMEYRLRRADGEYCWFLETGIPRVMPDGNFVGYIGSCVDITERKQAEIALLESELRYRTLFENTGTSIIIIEEDTTISLANEEFVRRIGYRRDEIEGLKKWTEFIDIQDIEQMVAQHQLRRENPGAVPSSYEFHYRTKSGELRNALINVQLLPNTRKSIASIVDITDRKKAEKAINVSIN
jgi:PAS domain S-box-containing protein